MGHLLHDAIIRLDFWRHRGRGGSVEGFACGLICSRLLPDVCSYCVSRKASVKVARRGLIVACRDLPITCFLLYVWGIALLKKLNTETCVYCTKIGIVMFISNASLIRVF